MKGFGRLRDRGLIRLQEQRFVLCKPLSHGSRGRSSRQCLSSGAGEARCGSRPASEVHDRPNARSLFQQAGPGDEPIIRLPKLPTFLLPVRWYSAGLRARSKPAVKGDKSKSCRAGLPRRRWHAGQELDSSPLVVGSRPRCTTHQRSARAAQRFLTESPKTTALRKRGPATEKSGGLGDHERLWPLEGPRLDTSTGTAFRALQASFSWQPRSLKSPMPFIWRRRSEVRQ